jgi:hypothetical protein
VVSCSFAADAAAALVATASCELSLPEASGCPTAPFWLAVSASGLLFVAAIDAGAELVAKAARASVLEVEVVPLFAFELELAPVVRVPVPFALLGAAAAELVLELLVFAAPPVAGACGAAEAALAGDWEADDWAAGWAGGVVVLIGADALASSMAANGCELESWLLGDDCMRDDGASEAALGPSDAILGTLGTGDTPKATCSCCLLATSGPSVRARQRLQCQCVDVGCRDWRSAISVPNRQFLPTWRRISALRIRPLCGGPCGNHGGAGKRPL